MTLPNQPRAVVTGAGGGIGRAFALDVATRRGAVLCSDVDLAHAEETARLVEQRGATAFATRCDVAKLADVEALADEAERRLGGVDLVINNAGVGCAGAIGEVPIDDWRWLVDIDLWGVIYGCHVFVPRLRAQRSGHILNVASVAGIVAGPRMGPYNVAKAGVIALTETLATELVGSGVDVTVLCPSFIKTNILEAGRGIGRDPAGKKMAQRLMDSAKLTADDVARIALDAAARGDLYCLPQPDARWMWRLKRADPVRFYRSLGPRISKLVNGEQGVDWKSIAKTLFA